MNTLLWRLHRTQAYIAGAALIMLTELMAMELTGTEKPLPVPPIEAAGALKTSPTT